MAFSDILTVILPFFISLASLIKVLSTYFYSLNLQKCALIFPLSGARLHPTPAIVSFHFPGFCS